MVERHTTAACPNTRHEGLTYNSLPCTIARCIPAQGYSTFNSTKSYLILILKLINCVNLLISNASGFQVLRTILSLIPTETPASPPIVSLVLNSIIYGIFFFYGTLNINSDKSLDFDIDFFDSRAEKSRFGINSV